MQSQDDPRGEAPDRDDRCGEDPNAHTSPCAGIPIMIDVDPGSTRSRRSRSAFGPLPDRGATRPAGSRFDAQTPGDSSMGFQDVPHPWVLPSPALMHILFDHPVIDNRLIVDSAHFLQTFAGKKLACTAPHHRPHPLARCSPLAWDRFNIFRSLGNPAIDGTKGGDRPGQGAIRNFFRWGAFLGGGWPVYFQCAVEQRLARQAHNLEVVGSIPTGAT